ncbi:CHRD domain-containing protein [Paucibacter sp. PLA-PC-4]|uniref:CHRD domain-containing protein n=1 Tax=Paucibacter sp. PLA-PC-4 TaxID=2993655 RepID=UPI00224AD41F|nr:CHRD domain-containing protein [Paucibacter sp. PLA-PC-4]MCX2865637.1 CHRD domain-containing protein [Paucibacter sp. PLA-PC-4]
MQVLSFVTWRAATIGLLVASLAACGGGGGEAAPPETFQVTLTGDQEAPAAVATAALGKATLTLDRATRTVSATVAVDGLIPTAAHIHAAAPGATGSIVLPLAIAGNTVTLAPTALSAEQLVALDSGDLYLNVHSAEHPEGEIRGQIGREVYVARLTGSQETMPVASPASGIGRLVLDAKTGALSGEVELTGIDATAAHVHTGALGGDGAILVTLESHGSHGHYSVPAGTVLKPEDISSLRSGRLYFNAHSSAHPGGEIRGQIGRRVFTATADGAHVVPSTNSAAVGRGFVTYDPTTRELQGRLALKGVSASAAQIHQSPAGVNGSKIVALEPVAGSSDWVVPSSAMALSLEQAKALLAEGLHYTAHSTAFPAGEIRGQLRVAADDASPLMRIVSPVAGASVARGAGLPGAGSFDGAGFSINLEVITRDAHNVAAEEGLDVRNTSLLGKSNPKLPSLVVTVDTDLIKPDGTIIPKDTNLASLFNVAGSDDTPGAGITLWAGWHVLESFPSGTGTVTITASVTDAVGRVATDRVVYRVMSDNTSGQSLTPQAAGAPGDDLPDADGPEVTMIAPRPGSSVSTGPLDAAPTPPANASLMFIQVSALDRSGAGIAVNENGEGKPDAQRGTIVDGSQIAANGPNRNLSGLHFSFDVPLKQPNGNTAPAGQNLAPLFNIVGSERDPQGVRATASWVVGGSLVVPAGKTTVTAVARWTDNAGRTGSVSSTFGVSTTSNGQALTPPF